MPQALATAEAVALLGFEVPLAVPAAKVLCKHSPKRALAQALSEGRAVEAMIPHPVLST